MDVKQIAHDAALMADRAEAYDEAKKLGEEMIRNLLGRDYKLALTPILAASMCLNTVAVVIGSRFNLSPTDILLEMAGELRELAAVEPDYGAMSNRE